MSSLPSAHTRAPAAPLAHHACPATACRRQCAHVVRAAAVAPGPRQVSSLWDASSWARRCQAHAPPVRCCRVHQGRRHTSVLSALAGVVGASLHGPRPRENEPSGQMMMMMMMMLSGDARDASCGRMATGPLHLIFFSRGRHQTLHMPGGGGMLRHTQQQGAHTHPTRACMHARVRASAVPAWLCGQDTCAALLRVAF